MAPLPIPETAADVTAEWLTESLTNAGVLQGGRVTAARWERVGQEYGFTGIVGRVHLRYEDHGGNPPASLIAKLPMASDDALSAYRKLQARDPVLVDRYYERSKREARFYREIGPAFAPRLYHADVSEADRRVILLFEDVSDGRQGDVLRGCSAADATAVIDELGPFHGRWWGERAPATGFPRAGTDDPQTRQERYARRLPRFFSDYASSLPTGVTDIVEALESRLAAVARTLYARSQTLIHGDLHLDNLIFEARSDRSSVVVLDWQTVVVGPPGWDLTLLLFGSLDVEARRATERELLDRYLTLLRAHGVRGYSLEDVRFECRLALLVLLSGTVVWLTALDPDELTARERALQEAAIRDGRLTAALLDHDVGALLAEL